MKDIQKINKALVPVIITFILGVFAAFDISQNLTVGEMVAGAVTAISVYFVPNKK